MRCHDRHCGFATPEQTPTSRGFDSYFGYFGGFNDYLHAWSEMTCPNVASTNHSINYDNSTGADRTKCTSSSVHARHLRSTTDLWEDTHPAHGTNLIIIIILICTTTHIHTDTRMIKTTGR